MSNICVIYDDANKDKCKYDSLSIWGRPAIYYPIEAALESKVFEKIYLKTNSEYIQYIVLNKFKDKLEIFSDKYLNRTDINVCYLSSRAVMITGEELNRIYREWDRKSSAITVSDCEKFAFDRDNHTYMSVSDEDEPINVLTLSSGRTDENVQKILVKKQYSLVINCDEDFELALVLIKKRENAKILEKQIVNRIKEKLNEFKSVDSGKKCCCMIGHSQLDNWNVKELLGYKVRNCGIGGISSFQYQELILSSEMLECKDDLYIVMHGTNDIVYDYSNEQIVHSILKTIDYIRIRTKAPIIFIKCLHTFGRLDRDNQRIDALNEMISKGLPEDVVLVDVEMLDDEFGNLNCEYTSDGLHLNELGYKHLQELVEDCILQIRIYD